MSVILPPNVREEKMLISLPDMMNGTLPSYEDNITMGDNFFFGALFLFFAICFLLYIVIAILDYYANRRKKQQCSHTPQNEFLSRAP